MPGMTAVRMDEALRSWPNGVVDLATDVFGVPRPVHAACWLLRPSPAVQRIFWNCAGAGIGPDDRVHAAEGVVHGDAVRDVHDRLVGGGDAGRRFAVFFVDRKPHANWAHACTYVLVREDDGQVTSVEHEWPPAPSLRLVEVRRPVPDA